MRRSKAPSALNKAKRLCQSCDETSKSVDERQNSDPEDDHYEWGSRNTNGEIKQNTLKNKRVFNIVWRDITTKKHKTWKGDGTLEVNTLNTKAILKDETGKYIGCSSKLNINDLFPDSQMTIGGKEIEIQNEIVDEDELNDVCKRQVFNRNWGEEEWIDPKDLAEEEKKPKGGFKFKPNLVLKPPVAFSNVETNLERENRNKLPQPSTSRNSEIKTNAQIIPTSEKSKHLLPNKSKEYICFIQPSELQQFIFQKTLEYYSSLKQSLNVNNIHSLDIDHILKLICNHPSFINHKSTTNKLIQHLLPNLPDWTEMGPFDSGKLEFVQHFLTHLTQSSEKCVILAKNPNSLNMLQGLCDFMKIHCLRLNKNAKENLKTEIMTEFWEYDNDANQVLLVNTMEILKELNFSIHFKNLIVFEESYNYILNMLEEIKFLNIYYLITAFSIEEILLFDSYNNKEERNLSEILDELLNLSDMDNDCCYVHSKLECNCFADDEESTSIQHDLYKDWKHFNTPFNKKLLEISSLVNCAENIGTIFCKTP